MSGQPEMETAYQPPPWYKRLKAWYKRKTYRWKKEDSNLYNHAAYELDIWTGAGSKDDLYGDMLIKAVLELVEVFAKQGHSGMSASVTLQLFDRVVRFKNLMPLTDNPEEWNMVGLKMWQNKRCSEAFSDDGGKTYYLSSEGRDSQTRKPLILHTSEVHGE